MSDQPDNEQQGVQEQEQPDTSAATENTETSEHRIPKSRFDEVNNERKELKEQLAKLKSKEQEREQQLKLEQGQHADVISEQRTQIEKLNEQLATLQSARDALEKSVRARIDALPAEWHDAVPDFDDPAKTLQWLDTVAHKLTRPSAPNTNAGAMSDKTKSSTKLTAEQRDMAKLFGLTDEQYAAGLRDKPIES
jgi:seryl-tRNA synthetase